MSSGVPANLDVVDEAMAAVLRQKTEGERLAIAHGMWTHARKMILSVLRGEHPDWSEEQIGREAARRLSHGAT